MELIKWKVKDKVILFPKEWTKNEVMKWINAGYIRVCPRCGKLDVTYDHFNKCDIGKEMAIQINRQMYDGL